MRQILSAVFPENMPHIGISNPLGGWSRGARSKHVWPRDAPAHILDDKGKIAAKDNLQKNDNMEPSTMKPIQLAPVVQEGEERRTFKENYKSGIRRLSNLLSSSSGEPRRPQDASNVRSEEDEVFMPSLTELGDFAGGLVFVDGDQLIVFDKSSQEQTGFFYAENEEKQSDHGDDKMQATNNGSQGNKRVPFPAQKLSNMQQQPRLFMASKVPSYE